MAYKRHVSYRFLFVEKRVFVMHVATRIFEGDVLMGHLLQQFQKIYFDVAHRKKNIYIIYYT